MVTLSLYYTVKVFLSLLGAVRRMDVPEGLGVKRIDISLNNSLKFHTSGLCTIIE